MSLARRNKPAPRSGLIRRIAAFALAAGIGIYLVVSLVSGRLTKSVTAVKPLVIIGTNDRVYCFHNATVDDARKLGAALQGVGYFVNRGNEAILSMGPGGTIVSFATKEGAWADRNTVLAFEEIGRRVAVPLGGYPIKVRMIDDTRKVRREIAVAKLPAAGKDEIYYLGSATEAEAQELLLSLAAGMYLSGQGARVLLSKEDGTTLSFVVYGDTWKRPEAMPAFQDLVRRVAPKLGGLPIMLRLVDANMAPLTEVEVK
jgi:hypothetical protein